jgi:hypothetical protein
MNNKSSNGNSSTKICKCGCERSFTGRSNKLFIYDSHRYKYNNNKASELNAKTNDLSRFIKINYKVLEKYYPRSKGTEPLYLPNLILEGFSPMHYLGIVKDTKSGLNWFKIGPYAFRIENTNILISKI